MSWKYGGREVTLTCRFCGREFRTVHRRSLCCGSPACVAQAREMERRRERGAPMSEIRVDREEEMPWGSEGRDGIMMYPAPDGARCPACGMDMPRVHRNTREARNTPPGERRTRYYADCECGFGPITGWMRSVKEALERWAEMCREAVEACMEK